MHATICRFTFPTQIGRTFVVPEDTWQRTKGALIVALTSSFVLASRSVSFLGIMVFRVCVRQKNGFVDPRERSKEGYFGLI